VAHPSEDRRSGEERRRDGGGISRAEAWRLVDDNNQQWRDAHSRQTNAIDRLTQTIETKFNALTEKMLAHETEDRAVALVVHDMLEREKHRKRQAAAAAALVSMFVGPGAAVLFKRWFGFGG